MHQRSTTKLLFGATAVLAFSATVAFAQDTTGTRRATSTRRIPISKEASGEVTRVDTVTVYKTDTLNMSRVDTVTVTNTVTRVDTVQAAPIMRPVRLPVGMWFGVGAGMNLPEGSLYVPNSPGSAYQAQLGWQGHALGLRLDGSYSQLGEDSQYAPFQADPDIVNVNGDLKLALPFAHHLFGLSPRFSLYALGGGSYVTYKNLPMVVNAGFTTPTGGTTLTNGVLVGDTPWQHKFGWNAGGGMSLGWNRTELFLESRVIQFNADNAPSARQIPIVLGINWY